MPKPEFIYISYVETTPEGHQDGAAATDAGRAEEDGDRDAVRVVVPALSRDP
jgi:hypothetical protein